MTEEKIKELKDEILVRNDLMQIFRTTTQTITYWVKSGIVREHHFGGNRYFIWSEVLEDLKNDGHIKNAVVRR